MCSEAKTFVFLSCSIVVLNRKNSSLGIFLGATHTHGYLYIYANIYTYPYTYIQRESYYYGLEVGMAFFRHRAAKIEGTPCVVIVVQSTDDDDEFVENFTFLEVLN